MRISFEMVGDRHHGTVVKAMFAQPICRDFQIDGKRGFMIRYVCSPELNSVATEVRTGAMKAVG